MIIADVTRSFENTADKFVRLLLRRMSLTRAKATIVFHHRQQASLGVPHGVEILAVSDWAVPHDIAAIIREQLAIPLLNATSTETLEVYSFHPAVLALASGLPVEAAARTQTIHWKRVNEDGTIFTPQAALHRAPIRRWIPPGAVEVLVNVLRKNPAGLTQTTLRDLVVTEMPVLDKNLGGPPISTVVAAAREQGLVDVMPPGHVNPHIRLSSLGLERGSTAIAPVSPESDPRLVTESETVTGAAALAPVFEAGPKESDSTPGFQGITEPALEAKSQEPQSRVEVFYDILRKNNFGPFPRHRQQMFGELEKLALTETYSANRLVKKAARSCVTTQHMPYGWSTIESFLFNLLNRCPIFLDREGVARSPRDASSAAHAIVRLKEGWLDLLESEMLVFLAEKDGNLKMTELDWVGYVMFANLDNDDLALERIDKLVAIAEADERMHTVDGVFVVGPDPKRLDQGGAVKLTVLAPKEVDKPLSPGSAEQKTA